MSVEETDRTVRQYLAALLNGGDFASYFADEILWQTMETGVEIRGRAAVKDFIVALHREFFDASPEFGILVVGDGVAVLEAVFVGTHIAEFGGVQATGIPVRFPYVVSYDVSGGQISTLRAYFPITALLRDLNNSAAVTHA